MRSHESYQNLAAFDSKALANDMMLHPSNKDGTKWNGSDAQQFLRADMELGLHTIMPPKDLQSTRPEYKKFTLKVFRDHIYQEERRGQSIAFWKTTAKKKKT